MEVYEADFRAKHQTSWDDPEPLPEGLPAVDALDSTLLPDALRPWLADVAERMQIPLDYPAAAAVVALGALVGRKIGIHPKRRDDWLVVPNLWGGIVGRPAMMKSPAIQQAIAPLDRLVTEALKVHQAAQADYEQAVEMAAARKKARKVRMEQAAKNPRKGDLKAIAAEVVEDPEPPPLRRYMTQDGTVAAIGQLLLDNPHGLLVLRDELVGWLKSLDREGNEGDRAFFLESWNGQGSFTVDRIGRGTLHIPALTLSVFGSIQPGPLADYVWQASRQTAGDDGLLQRFQLLVWPDPPSAWRNVDRWPNTEAKNRAFAVFKALDRLTPEQAAAVADDPGAIPTLRFAPDAQEVFDEWRNDLERRLRDGSIQSPALESHLAKYRSLFPSLALVFHLVDVVDGLPAGPVSEAAALRAGAWCKYLESHARRLYATVEDPVIEGARVLLERLKAGEVERGDGGTVSLRELCRHHWTGLTTPKETQNAVEVLEDYGWIRTARLDTGGRPKTLIYLHPVLLGRCPDERNDKKIFKNALPPSAKSAKRVWMSKNPDFWHFWHLPLRSV
ncbi:MAG: YfjI family protein [Pseudomonadota bacterium]|nr:YfjI family protein [Pseudomonadota bacterium]